MTHYAAPPDERIRLQPGDTVRLDSDWVLVVSTASFACDCGKGLLCPYNRQYRLPQDDTEADPRVVEHAAIAELERYRNLMGLEPAPSKTHDYDPQPFREMNLRETVDTFQVAATDMGNVARLAWEAGHFDNAAAAAALATFYTQQAILAVTARGLS